MSRDGSILAAYEILPEVKWRGTPGGSQAHFRHVAENLPTPHVPPGAKLPGFNPGGSIPSALADAAELGRPQALSLLQRLKGVPWGMFGMTALVWLGRVGMVGGAHNEGMRSYHNAPGNDDKKSGAYAITFFCTFFAGFVDDGIAATVYATPVGDRFLGTKRRGTEPGRHRQRVARVRREVSGMDPDREQLLERGLQVRRGAGTSQAMTGPS